MANAETARESGKGKVVPVGNGEGVCLTGGKVEIVVREWWLLLQSLKA